MSKMVCSLTKKARHTMAGGSIYGVPTSRSDLEPDYRDPPDPKTEEEIKAEQSQLREAIKAQESRDSAHQLLCNPNSARLSDDEIAQQTGCGKELVVWLRKEIREQARWNKRAAIGCLSVLLVIFALIVWWIYF